MNGVHVVSGLLGQGGDRFPSEGGLHATSHVAVCRAGTGHQPVSEDARRPRADVALVLDVAVLGVHQYIPDVPGSFQNVRQRSDPQLDDVAWRSYAGLEEVEPVCAERPQVAEQRVPGHVAGHRTASRHGAEHIHHRAPLGKTCPGYYEPEQLGSPPNRAGAGTARPDVEQIARNVL
jgi:hypothetical protein